MVREIEKQKNMPRIDGLVYFPLKVSQCEGNAQAWVTLIITCLGLSVKSKGGLQRGTGFKEAKSAFTLAIILRNERRGGRDLTGKAR